MVVVVVVVRENNCVTRGYNVYAMKGDANVCKTWWKKQIAEMRMKRMWEMNHVRCKIR